MVSHVHKLASLAGRNMVSHVHKLASLAGRNIISGTGTNILDGKKVGRPIYESTEVRKLAEAEFQF